MHDIDPVATCTFIDVIPGVVVVVVSGWVELPYSVNPRKFPYLVLITRPKPADVDGIEAALAQSTGQQCNVTDATKTSSNSLTQQQTPWSLGPASSFIVTSRITGDHGHGTSMIQFKYRHDLRIPHPTGTAI